MAISPEFRSLAVWPSHGARTAVVSWTVDPAILGGDFYVYRSPDGMGEWRLLNNTPVNGLFMTDSDFHVADRSRIPHYRVLCELDGEEYESPLIGLFETLKRSEQGLLNRMRQEELRRMRGGNGLQVWYYPALIGGLPCPYTDKETQMHLGHGCANTDDDCYGTGRIGGYRAPMPVWAEIYTRSSQSGDNRLPEVGQTDRQILSLRLLMSFIPQIGDLVVMPMTDDRALIGDDVKVSKLKGVAPLVADAQLEILPRSHDAYRLARPEAGTL